MFRSFLVFITILILLSACRPALQTTPQPDQPTITSSPLLTATPTRTAPPSATLTASTPALAPGVSVTPLPTIPTFTPTFDVSTIITVTPAPKAECSDTTRDEIVNNLNSSRSTSIKIITIDITNDGVLDLIVENHMRGTWLVITAFVCKSAKYEEFDLTGTDTLTPPSIAKVADLNNNGIPEIVTIHNECTGTRNCDFVEVLEWNSINFTKINDPNEHGLGGAWSDFEIEFKDIDENDTLEIVVTENIDPKLYIWTGGHSRSFTKTFTWNGSAYVSFYYETAPPVYRFEAVQDADRWIGQAQFNKALDLYLGTINNDKLLSWSEENGWNYTQNLQISDGYKPTLTPPPSDPVEYPSLAAYAYYRIMLLHLVQGHETDATTVYNTLQQKFSNDPYGRPYVEMATTFWNAHQSMHKMYDGCAAAIQYAVEHPEILTPLGSDYHGAQSHQYKPEDVCPFR